MKIMIIAGARPNFMKVAPLIRAIEKLNNESSADIEYVLVHTGQHYDIKMSEVFFADLDLPQPDVNLEVGSASHAIQTANIMIRFEEICLRENPDWLLVVGDVNSTMACTLVAAKLGVKIGHVEAGLRSFDRSMPEEINRLVTDTLADLLFTPSEDADANLRREGIPVEKIKRVGNIMIDTLMAQLVKARQREMKERLGLSVYDYALVTLHRAANTDDVTFLSGIMAILNRLSAKLPIVFPVHPRTRKQLQQYGLLKELHASNRLMLIDPQGYHDFLNLLETARVVITDSGGLQEETTYLRVPCLTLRQNTERPITITKGTNQLSSLETLEGDIEKILGQKDRLTEIPEFWDGMAGERILHILAGNLIPDR